MQKQAKTPDLTREQAGGNCTSEQKRAHTDNCHRQVKGKKEERKQILGE